MPPARGPARAGTLDGVAELASNGGRTCYRAQVADAAAFRRVQRPKPAKLVLEPQLRAVVEAKLAVRVVAGADRRLAAAGLPRRRGAVGSQETI